MKYYVLIIFCVVAQISGMEQLKKHWSDGEQFADHFAFVGDIVSYEAKPLSGGLGEPPVLCTVNGNKYVARLFKDEDWDDRRTKTGIYYFAGEAELAPKVHRYGIYNNDSCYVIMDFIDTHTLSLEQARRTEVISCVAHKLNKINEVAKNLPMSHKETVFDEIARMHNTIEKKQIGSFAAILEEMKNIAGKLHQSIQNDDRPLVFNHNDFHPRNIFFIDNDIKIIDWDTVCPNYQFYDLVGYSLFTCLNKEQDLHLLTEYLEREPTLSDIDYFKKVKLAGRVCLVLSGMQCSEVLAEELSIEPAEDFETYATAFAQNDGSDSFELFYNLGVSQLKELRREYKEFENL